MQPRFATAKAWELHIHPFNPRVLGPCVGNRAYRPHTTLPGCPACPHPGRCRGMARHTCSQLLLFVCGEAVGQMVLSTIMRTTSSRVNHMRTTWYYGNSFVNETSTQKNMSGFFSLYAHEGWSCHKPQAQELYHGIFGLADVHNHSRIALHGGGPRDEHMG